MRIRHLAIASALSLAALASDAPNALAQQAAAMKYCKAMWRGSAPAFRWAAAVSSRALRNTRKR